MSVLRADASSSMAMDAAALAWVTVSGMSLGSAAAPPTNTPGREVDSGRSRSVSQKPNSLSFISRREASSARPGGGSMPTDRTMRSEEHTSELQSPMYLV